MSAPESDAEARSPAEAVPRQWWRYTVSLVGALLLGVSVGSVLVDGRIAGDEPVQAAGLIVLTLLLTAGGSRIAVTVTDRGDMLRIVLWLSGGVIAFAVLGAWLQVVFRTVETGFDAALVFLSVLAAGALFGAVVGYYDVRVRGLAARAGREQARREFLAEQQETLSTLNGILRHQILNDLAAISGRAELLSNGRIGAEAAAESVLEHCEHMDSTVDRIETLIDVLTFTTETRPVSVATAVDRAVDRLRRSHPDAAVTVAGDPDGTVLADDLLALAIHELLDNAVVHGESPQVEVTVAEGTVTIAVSDAGDGVVPEEGSLFEPNTRGPDSDGDGLGLFVADLIVDRYGGTVRLADGERTRFEIAVPAAADRA